MRNQEQLFSNIHYCVVCNARPFLQSLQSTVGVELWISNCVLPTLSMKPPQCCTVSGEYRAVSTSQCPRLQPHRLIWLSSVSCVGVFGQYDLDNVGRRSYQKLVVLAVAVATFSSP